MRSLLDWREHEYFEQRKDHYFLVDIIMLRVCKLTFYKGNYWFEYPGIHLKATTTPCVSLKDLHGTKVRYKNEPLVRGTIMGYGIKNSPYVHVYWSQVPLKDNNGKQLGFPCALPDNNNLELL